MGIVIKLKDVEFTNILELAEYPKLPSLQGLYFLDNTQNIASGTIIDESGKGNDGTITGTITMDSSNQAMVFNGTYASPRIDTGIAAITTPTFIYVAMKDTSVNTNSRAVISNYSSSGIECGTGATTCNSGGAKNVGTSVSDTKFEIVCVQVTETSVTVYKYDTANKTFAQYSTLEPGTLVTSTKTYRIGGAHQNMTNNGGVVIAMAGIYNTLLSKEAMDSAGSYLCAKYKGKLVGIE